MSVVRAQWPVDACNFLHAGAAETLAGLSQISSAELVAEFGQRIRSPAGS